MPYLYYNIVFVVYYYVNNIKGVPTPNSYFFKLLSVLSKSRPNKPSPSGEVGGPPPGFPQKGHFSCGNSPLSDSLLLEFSNGPQQDASPESAMDSHTVVMADHAQHENFIL
jgi:hypothetical protein